jgi:DNA ligase-1
MSAVEIIKQLQATGGRNDKEKIIEDAWKAGERQFFVAAKMAYDPLLTFGVKKVAEIVSDDGLAGTFTFDDFLVLANKLARRELTGNAARDAINQAAEVCTFDHWNLLYRRVLLRDLRCGVNEKTINKVLEKIAEKIDPTARDYLIPIFGTMLAHDGRKHEKKIRGVKMLDQKLDGVRLLTVIDKARGTVKQFTRNGLENTNFQSIIEKFEALLPHLPGSVVLDGEIISRNFQELMTQVNRKDGVDTSDAKLALFDIIPLDDFTTGFSPKTQKERHDALCALSGLLQEHCGQSVYVIPKMTIDLDTEEGKVRFNEFNRETLAAGYEGVMLKDPDAPYEGKRSVAWLKLKPFITLDMTVSGAEEGEAGKQFEGTLGALIGECIEDGKKVVSKVGSGFTPEQRDEIWAAYLRGEIKGQVFEAKADCLTKERDSDEVWSLRFPSFMRWRSIDGRKHAKD